MEAGMDTVKRRMARTGRVQEIRTPEGLPPNTLSNNAARRSPAFTAVRGLREHEHADAGERLRTGVSETKTETSHCPLLQIAVLLGPSKARARGRGRHPGSGSCPSPP